MSWLELAFLHIPINVGAITAVLPPGLTVDEFGGTAWIGVVPFRMARVTPRRLPAVPFFSTFPELNVRTYVERDGKPGVWFFSLDAASWPTVVAGRQLFDLPYFRARIEMSMREGWYCFDSTRLGSDATFRARYRPAGDVTFARPGTFEHWATERYCLYAHSARRGVSRIEVHHTPWPLQRADVDVGESTVISAAGLTPANVPPICHFSRGVEVVCFSRERL